MFRVSFLEDSYIALFLAFNSALVNYLLLDIFLALLLLITNKASFLLNNKLY